MSAPTVRDAILDAALDAFLAEDAGTVTIAAIADCAHVSVGAIYHHFGGKDGLQMAAARYVMDILLDDYLGPPITRGGSAAQRAIDHCLAYVRFVEERPREYRLLTSISHGGDLSEHARADSQALNGRVGEHLGRLQEMTREGQAAGEIRSGDPAALVLLTWSALYGLCMLSARYPAPLRGTTGRSALADLAEQVVISALTPEAAVSA